jgi:glycosyltransferase involved in cell wall biosynthesis
VGAGRNGFSDTIRQRAGQLNLQNVVLDGPKSQMEVLEVMRQSDILVLPSRLEGIPRVTLEAAATGLPCLVFRDYQTPSVVDGVTGFQVSTDEEMLIRLGQLIDDSDLRTRMGKAAREHVARFDWDVVGPQWESAYLQIAAEH